MDYGLWTVDWLSAAGAAHAVLRHGSLARLRALRSRPFRALASCGHVSPPSSMSARLTEPAGRR